MNVITKVLVFLKKLFASISEPIGIILKAFQKLVRGVLRTLLGAPAEAVDSVGQRIFQRASKMDSSLDAKADAQKERDLEKKMDAALERLYYTDNFLIRARSVRRWKNFWILLIEMVSFVTTYRGLNQIFSTLHFAVPFLMAVVIQTALGYLSAAASSSGSTPKQKGLLVVMLAISITFSYVGVTETILPYSSHAQAQYNEFIRAYHTAKEHGKLAVEAGSSPVAEISGQYMKVGQLLADASSRYSDEVLEGIDADIATYKSMTVPIMVDCPDTLHQDASGNWIRKDGGNDVIWVLDPDAKRLIESAEEEKDIIEERRRKIEEINALLQSEAEQATVTDAMEKQTASDGPLTPTFIEACKVALLLSEKCQELAREMGSSITVQIDLSEILQAYRDSKCLGGVEDIRPFPEIYNDWEEAEIRPADTGIELLDATLAVIVANNPSLLKERLDQEVENAYGTLLAALEYIGTGELAGALTRAYQAYHLELPMLYAFGALHPASEHFGIAVLAAIIALINDSLAVLIGLWMEQKCMNWCSRRTIGINDLMPHLYPHFRAVIMPELRQLIGWDFTFEQARDAFALILEDYLSRFKLEPLLIREGFTRCGKVSGADSGFETFCGFLLTWGLAKPISREDIQTLGLTCADSSESQYILLSSRAEGWLIDLLGNAAEVGYNELTYSV